MTTANLEISSASDVTGRTEMLSSQERAGRKDDTGSASDSQLVMSIFFSILQNRLSALDATEKTRGNQVTAETSLKGAFRKEWETRGSSREGMTTATTAPVEGQKNAESLIAQISGLFEDGKGAGQNFEDFLKANGLTAETLRKLLTTAGEGGKGEAFLKNIAAWLKNNGLQDSSIEQIISQIKNMAVDAGDELSQNAYRKEMADFLKNQRILDKEIRNMHGGAKGSSTMSEGQLNMAQTGEDLSKNFVLSNMDSKTGVTANGLEKQSSTTAALHEMMSAVTMPNDDNFFSANNGLMADQKYASFFAGNNEGAGKAAYPANMRPQELIEQIVQNRQLFERGTGRVRITLNPPSLGTLDMDVRVRNNKVEVMMMAENRDVKQILQTNLEELKTALREQGLSVERFNIQWQNQNAGQGSFRFAGEDSPWREGRSGSRAGRKTDTESGLHAEEYPVNAVASTDGNTRLISVII